MADTPVYKSANDSLTDDPAAAMARAKEFARRVLSVPKTSLSPQQPEKPVKASKRRRRKPDA